MIALLEGHPNIDVMIFLRACVCDTCSDALLPPSQTGLTLAGDRGQRVSVCSNQPTFTPAVRDCCRPSPDAASDRSDNLPASMFKA
jgi:hypothetical protein